MKTVRFAVLLKLIPGNEWWPRWVTFCLFKSGTILVLLQLHSIDEKCAWKIEVNLYTAVFLLNVRSLISSINVVFTANANVNICLLKSFNLSSFPWKCCVTIELKIICLIAQHRYRWYRTIRNIYGTPAYHDTPKPPVAQQQPPFNIQCMRITQLK